MDFSAAITIHIAAALAAVVVGPMALWTRLGHTQRPRLHRAAGHAWVTLMVAAAVSALFITGTEGPRFAGFGLIHLLVPYTLCALAAALFFAARGKLRAHRQIMQQLYIGACLVAGAFSLSPDRRLGHWLWGQFGLV